MIHGLLLSSMMKVSLRSAFESWMNAISRTDTNTGATNPSSYMTNAMVLNSEEVTQRSISIAASNSGR